MSAIHVENALLPAEEAQHVVKDSNGRLRRPTLRKVAVLVLSFALLGAAWFELASPQLGGQTSYVVANGVSMLPRYHAGDLIALRNRSSYHVGEVAGYRNGELHEVVMHRIVAIHGDRYVFKGDSNSWVDSFEPTKSQIVGAEWWSVSGGGRYFVVLRNPFVAAFLLGLLWLFSFGRDRESARAAGRRHRRAQDAKGHGRDDS